MQAAGNRNLLGPSATNRGLKLLCRAALLITASTLFIRPASAQNPPAPAKCPPAARVDSARDTYGSIIVADPYRWLEDQNSPVTRAWIDAEQKCTEAALSNLPGRADLARRLTTLRHITTYQSPRERGGRYFFQKRLADQDLEAIYLRRSRDAADELLIDPAPWSRDHSASAAIRAVSKDGKFLFYGRREGGQDELSIHVLDVDARRDLPDVLPLRALYQHCYNPRQRRPLLFSRYAGRPTRLLPRHGQQSLKRQARLRRRFG